MRAHHDQIAADLPGDAEDFRRRVSILYSVLCSGGAIRGVELVHGALQLTPVAVRPLERSLEFSVAGKRGRRGDMQDDQPGAVVPRQCQGQQESLSCALGKIGRGKDGLDS
jgi:hypothetical protein